LFDLTLLLKQARIIRKTTDNGKTWWTVFEGSNTFTLAQSTKDEQVTQFIRE